jgi:acetylornithine deacetylase/succinyl-diaminopimelate desuccinylase-like protein
LPNKIDMNSDIKKTDSDDYDYDLITDLQTLIRQPSVSAKNQGLAECANLVAQLMRKAGISAELLYIDKDLQESTDGNIDPFSPSLPPPIVYGEVNHPFVSTVKDAAMEVYGDVVINVSAAGTGPMYYFDKVLGVPCICIGGTDISNRSHSPNEYMRIDSLNNTVRCIAVILEKFSHETI